MGPEGIGFDLVDPGDGPVEAVIAAFRQISLGQRLQGFQLPRMAAGQRLQMSDALIHPSQRQEADAQIDLSLDVLRVTGDRLLKGPCGLRVPVEAEIGAPQIKMGVGEIGVEGQGTVDRIDSRAQPSLVLVDQPQPDHDLNPSRL